MPFTHHNLEVSIDKSFYRPGEPLYLEVQVYGVRSPINARLRVAVTHLTRPVLSVQQDVNLKPGEQRFSLTIQPPVEAPRGYGLDVFLETPDGKTLAAAASAFDVLEHWTQTPRYGFLSDFSPDRQEIEESMAAIQRYRINGLQFYDWMYRHEQLLTDEEPYVDLLGRRLSLETVLALIESAHTRNIAAMPYTAIYGASLDFFKEHPDWGLYRADGQPVYFGEDFMVIMDPRPDSPWNAHLLKQFEHTLEETPFDGIHLDQYGDPKTGYDASGQPFALDDALAQTIDVTSRLVREKRPDGAVIFNAVTNWPIEKVAPAEQDLVYIEVWAPYTRYRDLQSLVLEAQELGGGKPVVLAAYIDPAFEINARLMDAVIFASGGSRIELGENNAMLADPYFPNYKAMSAELAGAMENYYSFAVRYQDVIGPRTRDASDAYRDCIQVETANVPVECQPGKLLAAVRSSQDSLAINLVNFHGVEQEEWAQPAASAPLTLEHFAVQIQGVDRPVKRVWSASPDGASIAPQSVEFTQEEDTIKFRLPSLKYWRLAVLEWR